MSTPTLTPRQQQILTLLADDYSTTNIAAILDISEKTVDAHETAIRHRLKVHHRAAAVAAYVREQTIRALAQQLQEAK